MNQSPGYSFERILLELAEAFGQAAQTESGIALPSNAYELDKLKRRANDGLRELKLAKPNGWWCLRPVASITIGTDSNAPSVLDGDTALYRLPVGVTGQPSGDWFWSDEGGTFTGLAKSRSWEQVTLWNTVQQLSGPPSAIAVYPVAGDRSSQVVSPLWQAQVYPRPDQTYTLTARFRVDVADLRELSTKHPFGALHDATVLAAAKWCYARGTTDSDLIGLYKADYDRLLAASIAADNLQAPQELGSMDEGLEVPQLGAWGNTRGTYNDVII